MIDKNMLHLSSSQLQRLLLHCVIFCIIRDLKKLLNMKIKSQRGKIVIFEDVVEAAEKDESEEVDKKRHQNILRNVWD